MRPGTPTTMLDSVTATTNPTSNVEETLRDMWATRPRRPLDSRKIAGVAAGIAERYDIDPVIVRVAFVVTTIFGGAGPLLYLLGWLFLVSEDDNVSAFGAMTSRRPGSTSTGLTVLLCLLLIPASGWLFDSTFSSMLGLAALGGGLFLLHRSRGHLNRPTVMEATTMTSPTAQDWDPLGAEPAGWDLPDPQAPQPERPPREPREPREPRSRTGAITFGIALLTAGVCAALATQLSWLTFPHIIGIVLAVLGLGLLAGAFTGGTRGLIPLTVALIAIGVLLTGGFHGVGDHTYEPKTLADVQSRYELSAGDLKVDLSNLPNSGEITTVVNNQAGDTTVTVPRDADVYFSCAARAGNLKCLDHEADGANVTVSDRDLGPDGEGGLRINLDVHSVAGDLKVKRD
jgi:phage shock protein PspC (stress-responsive transcriptional regulator)